MPREAALTFQPYLARLAEEGYSGRGAIRFLRDNGLQFADADFWPSWRANLSHEQASVSFRSTQYDRAPTESLYTRVPWELSTRYATRFRVEFERQDASGNWVPVITEKPQYFTLGHEVLMTRRTLESAMTERLEEYNNRYGTRIRSIKLEDGYSRID